MLSMAEPGAGAPGNGLACDFIDLNRYKLRLTTQWAFASGFHCEP